MSEKRPHALTGVNTLNHVWHRGMSKSNDAARSIQLVTISEDDPLASRVNDPVLAARDWIDSHVDVLDVDLRNNAEKALKIAEAHLADFHHLVLELTTLMNAAVTPDVESVARLDEMAGQMNDFNERLRRLLECEQPATESVERLERGLCAVSAGGGFSSLIDAM